jgi:hypothetical protein
MNPDASPVQEFLNQSMTMRVATRSRRGVPHITPLRFVHHGRTIYAETGAATPTARHVCEHPGVVLLFDAEQTEPTAPVLRIRARAATRGEPRLRRGYERRAAIKYFLAPGGVWNMLTHWRRLPAWVRTRRTAPADTVLIEFTLETAEFVPRPH